MYVCMYMYMYHHHHNHHPSTTRSSSSHILISLTTSWLMPTHHLRPSCVSVKPTLPLDAPDRYRPLPLPLSTWQAKRWQAREEREERVALLPASLPTLLHPTSSEVRAACLRHIVVLSQSSA